MAAEVTAGCKVVVAAARVVGARAVARLVAGAVEVCTAAEAGLEVAENKAEKADLEEVQQVDWRVEMVGQLHLKFSGGVGGGGNGGGPAQRPSEDGSRGRAASALKRELLAKATFGRCMRVPTAGRFSNCKRSGRPPCTPAAHAHAHAHARATRCFLSLSYACVAHAVHHFVVLLP